MSRRSRGQQLSTSQPAHDGAAYYSIRETTIAWKMSCRDVAGLHRVRSTRTAQSMRLHDSSEVTRCGGRRPSTCPIHNDAGMRILVTRSMPGRGSGVGGGIRLRIQHAKKTISFVLSPFSRRLFAFARVCMVLDLRLGLGIGNITAVFH